MRRTTRATGADGQVDPPRPRQDHDLEAELRRSGAVLHLRRRHGEVYGEIELVGDRIASDDVARALAQVPPGWPVRFVRVELPAPRRTCD